MKIKDIFAFMLSPNRFNNIMLKWINFYFAKCRLK
jgi:hypothetical protein